MLATVELKRFPLAASSTPSNANPAWNSRAIVCLTALLVLAVLWSYNWVQI
ncbi:MAG TPA: hypothetical protein V6D18_05800 [Thermosynechococcaceae cyanobacterium]